MATSLKFKNKLGKRSDGTLKLEQIGNFFTMSDYFSMLCANLKCTGKSLSEALIFASTNPQYDNRLFIELQVQ